TEWRQGGVSLYAQGISESDDAGRPITGTFDAADRLAVAAAGDSLAVGGRVTPGRGGYDTVQVQGPGVFALCGPGAGRFAAQFARLGQGRGDYADSGVVGSHSVYRFVGPGLGAYRVGRALPAPESHKLASVGATVAAGPWKLDAEGAMSLLDRNTLS